VATVSVDTPEPFDTTAGLNEQVALGGQPAKVKETALLNPFTGLTVTV
jgi:hypothetical protein